MTDAGDPDALWKPGGPQQWTYDGEPQADAPNESSGPRSRRRIVRIGAGLAALAAVAAGALIVSQDGTTATAGEPIRMPDTATRLWSVSGPEFVAAADFGGDDELVVAIIDDGLPDAIATLLAFDGATGEELWRAPVSGPPSQVDLVDSISNTVIVSARRTIGTEDLIGFDAADGRRLWTRPSATGATFTAIDGSRVIAERDSLGTPGRTQLIDVDTGASIGAFTGRIHGSSAGGIVEHVNDRAEFVVDDVSDGLYDPEIRARDVGTDDHVAVVGDHVVIARADGAVDVADDTTATRVERSGVGRPHAIVRTAEDRALILAADGIAGLSVSDGIAQIEWTERVESSEVDRSGTVVLVTRSGAEDRTVFAVIDAVTGDELTEQPIPHSAADPVLVSNGVVVRETNHLGGSMGGFDFAGSERWTLSEPAVIRFGNGRVLALTTGFDAGFTITAYGDPP